MSAARFETLLHDFQDAEAKFGKHFYVLYAVTPEESKRLPQNEWEHIGVVPVGEDSVWSSCARPPLG